MTNLPVHIFPNHNFTHLKRLLHNNNFPEDLLKHFRYTSSDKLMDIHLLVYPTSPEDLTQRRLPLHPELHRQFNCHLRDYYDDRPDVLACFSTCPDDRGEYIVIIAACEPREQTEDVTAHS